MLRVPPDGRVSADQDGSLFKKSVSGDLVGRIKPCQGIGGV